MFWPQIFFGGKPPEFLDLHYKIEPDSYRVAKFDGDRPRELGDLRKKKKKTSRAFYKSSRYYVRAACVAEPDLKPPGAASPSAKSIPEDEIPLAVMAVSMKKFSENTSTIPEVMYCSTINFNPNFVFTFFPSPFRCVLVSLGQSLACVNISGRTGNS